MLRENAQNGDGCTDSSTELARLWLHFVMLSSVPWAGSENAEVDLAQAGMNSPPAEATIPWKDPPSLPTEAAGNCHLFGSGTIHGLWCLCFSSASTFLPPLASSAQ